MTRIAIVDDDQNLLDLLSELFRERGWDVVVSGDALQAVDTIKAAHPDLVILDIMMGAVYSGWKVLQLLKQDALLREIPVLVCSGVPDLGEKEEWLHERGIPTLAKPFDVDHLFRSVEALVSGGSGAKT